MEALVPSFLSNLGMLLGSAPPPERTGNRHGGLSVSPYNVYPTKDGHIAVLAQSDQQFVKLAAVLGSPHLALDDDFATANSRVLHNDALDVRISDWTSLRTTQDAFETLRAGGVPAAPVRTLLEVINDPHLREREIIFDTEVAGVGTLPLMQSPLQFEGEDRPAPGDAPGLGQHNARIYSGLLGLSDSEITDLQANGVI
jgi:formyl-CoA transferase